MRDNIAALSFALFAITHPGGFAPILFDFEIKIGQIRQQTKNILARTPNAAHCEGETLSSSWSTQNLRLLRQNRSSHQL
jgi:hypothetical protein